MYLDQQHSCCFQVLTRQNGELAAAFVSLPFRRARDPYRGCRVMGIEPLIKTSLGLVAQVVRAHA